MAVECQTLTETNENITLNVTFAEGDFVVVAVCGFTLTESGVPGVITPDVDWLDEVYQEIAVDVDTDQDGRFAVFAGRASVAGTSIGFSSDSMDWWGAAAKVLTPLAGGVTLALGPTDSDDKLVGAGAFSGSVGPLAVPLDFSRVVYAFMTFNGDQTEFEAGPTPALPVSQLGNSEGILIPIRVGIWTTPANAGDAGPYTQGLSEEDSGVWAAMVALCVTGACTDEGGQDLGV